MTNEQRREQLFAEVERHLDQMKPLSEELWRLEREEAADPAGVEEDPAFVEALEAAKAEFREVLLPQKVAQ